MRARTTERSSPPDLAALGRALVSGLLVPLLLSGLGCSGPTGAGQADDVACSIVLEPRRVGESRVSVALRDRRGEPLPGASLTVEANMTHPGMAPVLARIVEVGPGRYEAPIEISMAGDWVFTVEGTLADGRKLRREISVRGVTAE